MKKSKIVLIAAVLAVVAASTLTGQAAQPDFNEADFTVGLTPDQKGVVIQKYNGSAKAGSIPALIQGMPVRSIGPSAFAGSGVTAVTIPEGVTFIGTKAFYGCNLSSIVIPEGVQQISDDAFRKNPLTSVTLPQKSLALIDIGAFNETELTEITIPGSIGMVQNCFSGKKLQTVTISEGITSVSFYNCPALTTLNLPNSLKTIAGFKDCDSLTTLSLPNGLAGILNTGTFSNCDKLSSVTIPSSVKFIAPNAFSGCPALKTINLPDTAMYLGDGVFGDFSKLPLAMQAALNKQRAAVKKPDFFLGGLVFLNHLQFMAVL